MLKIPILGFRKSDVTKMSVKGWKVEIYRDNVGFKGHVTFAKGNTSFTLTQVDLENIELEKWVDNQLVETKHYGADGCENCEGTVYINDHSDPKRCYAFWRSKELQSFLDSCGIEKLTFSRSDQPKFEYEISTNANDYERVGYPFYTDGIITTDYSRCTYSVFDATYIWKPETEELIISQSYNIDQLASVLIDHIFNKKEEK